MLVVIILIVITCGFDDACTKQDEAQIKADNLAQNRGDIFIMKNDVEFKNYNKRQMIADDPTTILWCTFAFPIPASPLVTVPVMGKLTSGGKRPFIIDPLKPGPDGMYGSSGEYRYGFAPGDIYSDFYDIATYCTNKPMIWQREKTEIIAGVDATLLDAQNKAQTALKNGDGATATRIINDAIKAGK